MNGKQGSDPIRSVAPLCPTLCDPMNHSMPGLPVHHQLPEFTQTHVHRVGDAIQPSHPPSSRSEERRVGKECLPRVTAFLPFFTPFITGKYGISSLSFYHIFISIGRKTALFAKIFHGLAGPFLGPAVFIPEFTETHVHRVSDAILPSHPPSSPSPPAPNPSQHQSLFQ